MYICKSKTIVMTILTIKINERTKKGKAFLEFAKAFFEDGKDVELVNNKSPYNSQFVSEILKRSKKINKNELTRLNPDDIWGSIL